MASEVLVSIISSTPSFSQIKLEKKIPSTNLCIITCFTVILNLSENVLNKSCVSGLGGLISFSNAMAIDCASKAPIIIGNVLFPPFHLTPKHKHHFESGCRRFLLLLILSNS